VIEIDKKTLIQTLSRLQSRMWKLQSDISTLVSKLETETDEIKYVDKK
jgi:hypothetical protein